MARGKTRGINKRKHKQARNSSINIKRRRKNTKEKEGNAVHNEYSRENLNFKRVDEDKQSAEQESSDVESSEEEMEAKTSLEELVSTFEEFKQEGVESSKSDSLDGSDTESEHADVTTYDEMMVSEEETEDEMLEKSEKMSEFGDNLSHHFDYELKEEQIQQVLSKSQRSVKVVNLPCLGLFNFISYLPNQTFFDTSSSVGSNTNVENDVYAILTSYKDLLLTQRDEYEEVQLVNAMCKHVVNHVLKSRAKIIHHNAKLKRNTAADVEYRDQGLTRPKVIILVPFRSSAVRYVQAICSLLPTGDSTVMNKKRFYDEYANKVDDQTEKKRLSRKPADYQQLFIGNTDDNFRLGISVKKKCIRLYSPFYSSDILLASAVGLRMAINDDHDFLSSVEILVLDQTEVMIMQNWEHVIRVMEHLHLQPKESHGVDFSRVRRWSLEKDWAKCYRQTVLFSSFICSEFVAVFNRLCFNYSGLLSSASRGGADISRVAVQLPHTFQRFQVNTPKDDPEERFKFFTEVVFPQYKTAVMEGTLIFVSSYFDFVRLRNYFRKEDVNFAQICEYQEDGKTAEARDKFFHRHRKFLLYTERTHFYKRYIIKGIRHLLFYQLPLIPRFYSELCNLVQLRGRLKKGEELLESTSSVLISKYDSYRLAAIVGHDRAAKILSNTNKVHLLVSGDI